MKSSIAILFVTSMAAVIPVANAYKVAELNLQFDTIFSWYLQSREIKTNPASASDKAHAMKEALTLVQVMELDTDKETNFLFGLIDIKTFLDKGTLESQLQTIFKAGDDPVLFKYPMPDRVFKNISAVALPPENLADLSRVEKFLRKSYADQIRKTGRVISQEEDVVLVYRLVEAADLNQREDTSPKKQYMLCMFAVATKA